MDIWHKRLIYLQVLLLFGFIGTIVLFPCFWKSSSSALMGLLFPLEFGVLHRQDRENPDKVLYRKSPFFSFLDLLTVLLYIGLFLSDAWVSGVPALWFIPLFVYIAVRKIYIMKNYSYEI